MTLPGLRERNANMMWSKRATYGVLLAIGVIALALRVRGLAERCLWFDEAVSWRIIQLSVRDLLDVVARDNHPPLYFLLLKGWAGIFGTSVVALRSPSVVFGMLAVGFVYLLTKETGRGTSRLPAGGDEAALGAALLMALSALQINWSWNIRMYELGAMFAAASTWSLMRALRARSADKWWWLLYVALSLSFLYTHYFAAFTLAGHAVVVAVLLLVGSGWDANRLGRQRMFWNAGVAAAAIGVGMIPWARAFVTAALQVRHDYWSPPFSVAYVAETWYQAVVDPEYASLSGGLAYVVCGLCMGIYVAAAWRASAAAWLAIAAGTAPTILSAAASTFMGSHVFTERYLVFSHVFLIASFGAVVAHTSNPAVRRVLLGVAIAGSTYVYWAFYQGLDLANRPGSRAAAEFVVAQATEHDAVVCNYPTLYLPLMYHAGEPANWRLYAEHPVPHYLGSAVLSAGEVLDERALPGYIQDFARVFTVGGASTIGLVPFGPEWSGRRLARFTDPNFRDDIAIHVYERSRTTKSGEPQ